MDWKIKKSERLYDGHFKVDLLSIQHELFSGGLSSVLLRERVRQKNSVAVLPYDPYRDEIVLIEQFRVGPLGQDENPWLVEIIAGLVEEGESNEDVAHRETMEEANCKIERLQFISSFYPSPGGFSERAHLYFGKVNSENVSGIYGKDTESEDIRVRAFSVNEVFEMLDSGKIRSAIPMIALFSFKSMHLELKNKWAK